MSYSRQDLHIPREAFDLNRYGWWWVLFKKRPSYRQGSIWLESLWLMMSVIQDMTFLSPGKHLTWIVMVDECYSRQDLHIPREAFDLNRNSWWDNILSYSLSKLKHILVVFWQLVLTAMRITPGHSPWSASWITLGSILGQPVIGDKKFLEVLKYP